MSNYFTDIITVTFPLPTGTRNVSVSRAVAEEALTLLDRYSNEKHRLQHVTTQEGIASSCSPELEKSANVSY